jgi:competence protein ComEA
MAELQTLPGIGPIYAERIIIARREQPFMEKRDLLRVSGIGEKRLAQIEDLICLFFEANEEAE